MLWPHKTIAGIPYSIEYIHSRSQSNSREGSGNKITAVFSSHVLLENCVLASPCATATNALPSYKSFYSGVEGVIALRQAKLDTFSALSQILGETAPKG